MSWWHDLPREFIPLPGAKIVTSTPRAALLEMNSTQFWVPKSCIQRTGAALTILSGFLEREQTALYAQLTGNDNRIVVEVEFSAIPGHVSYTLHHHGRVLKTVSIDDIAPTLTGMQVALNQLQKQLKTDQILCYRNGESFQKLKQAFNAQRIDEVPA